MKFRRILQIIAILSIIFSCKEPPPRPVVRIIPLPAEVKEQKGIFVTTPNTRILINQGNEQLRQIAALLNGHTEKYYGITNSISTIDNQENGSIFLKLDEGLKMGKEDYHLIVNSKGVLIEAAAPNGLFYGVQTLIQLMPPTPKQLPEIVLPYIEIKIGRAHV